MYFTLEGEDSHLHIALIEEGCELLGVPVLCISAVLQAVIQDHLAVNFKYLLFCAGPFCPD